MTVIVNPFDAGGFTLAEMSAAIQMLPNPYGRVGQLGLFAPEPISQRNVTIESIEGELRLLPAVALGAPGSAAGGRNGEFKLREAAEQLPDDGGFARTARGGEYDDFAHLMKLKMKN